VTLNPFGANVIATIKQRLREPSTWAALAALLAVFGVPVPPGVPEAVGTIVAAGAAIVGVAMPEKKAAE
jgi:hypothetical protein